MKFLLPLLLMAQICSAQTTTTESFNENRWILNSGINLPAVKFHLAESSDSQESNGFLELFSSFGVGLGINYGKAKFTKDVDLNKVLENKTEFVNLVGFQNGWFITLSYGIPIYKLTGGGSFMFDKKQKTEKKLEAESEKFVYN